MTTEMATLRPARQAIERGRDRYRIVVVMFLSLGVVRYAAVTYFGFDPSDSKVGIRPDVPWHFLLLMAHTLTASVALLTTARPIAAAGLPVGDILWPVTAVAGYGRPARTDIATTKSG